MILDSHFHTLSMARRKVDMDLEKIIGIDVGTDPFDIEERLVYIKGRENIYYSQGAGPWCLKDGEVNEIYSRLVSSFEKYKGTFLGETGLDYFHKDYGDKREMIKLFLKQIELAEKLSLPIIIHSRDADDDMKEIISSSSFPHSGVMHSYSSDPGLMEKALEKGLYISFSGNITYKGNDKIRESVRACPKDRILYETDSPYLAPVPVRGRPSCPTFTEYTSAFIASLRNEDVEQFRKNAINNFMTLLSHSGGEEVYRHPSRE